MAAAGWKPNWWQLTQVIQHWGLPVLVRGVALHDELLVLELDANEGVLPRTHAQRGFPLHLSLLFVEELHKFELDERLRRLHARWAGRHVVLDVEWVGRGGAAMLRATDALAADADLQALHAAGWYRGRQVHVSL